MVWPKPKSQGDLPEMPDFTGQTAWKEQIHCRVTRWAVSPSLQWAAGDLMVTRRRGPRAHTGRPRGNPGHLLSCPYPPGNNAAFVLFHARALLSPAPS